jgi:hypothetical protein
MGRSRRTNCMAPKITRLKPAVFFIYGGHLKSTVYATAVNDVAELQRRIEDGCKIIRYTSGIIERVWQFLMRRRALCGNTRTTLWAFFLWLVFVRTVICNVGISNLKINTFLWTVLHFTFYPSPSKIKWAITRRWSVQGLVFTQTFFVVFVHRTHL